MNVGAYAGAYSMTHYSVPGQVGLGQPRPYSANLPSDRKLAYSTHRIPISENEWLEAWQIPSEAPPKGTVLLFHGNGSNKANHLLPSAQRFHQLGYDTWLVDFRGVGGSSGSTSTLGIRESEDVAVSLSYVQSLAPTSPFILYGISLGSVSVLKAAADKAVNVDALILEQPFLTLLEAVRARVSASRMPTFPMAELIVFWGSVQHGFNGFAHNPVSDAAQITLPVLLMQGEKDPWVTMAEINQLFESFRGYKQLTTFPTAAHSLLLAEDTEKWTAAVSQFLSAVSR